MSLGITQQTLVIHALTHPNLVQDAADTFKLNTAYAGLKPDASDEVFVKNSRFILTAYGFSAQYLSALKDAQILTVRTHFVVLSKMDLGISSLEYDPKSCRQALRRLVLEALLLEEDF